MPRDREEIPEAPAKIIVSPGQRYLDELPYQKIPRHKQIHDPEYPKKKFLVLPEDFIFEAVPPELEIATIVDDGRESLRFRKEKIDFLAGIFPPSSMHEIYFKIREWQLSVSKDWLEKVFEPELKTRTPRAPRNHRQSIRGVDIIPNLYHRLLWVREVLRKEQGELTIARPRIFESKHDDDRWIISYELSPDGICWKCYISKHPAVELRVELRPDGQLFLPKIPAEPPELKTFLLGETRRLDLRYS